MEVEAIAVFNPKEGSFKRKKILRKSAEQLLPNDVVIRIKYAGICHSDVHQGR